MAEERILTDKVVAASIVAIAAVSSALIVANAITESAKHEPDHVISRFAIHNEYAGGWNVFDTATGRICSVPNGSDPKNADVICSAKQDLNPL